MKNYTIELNENQLRLISEAVEKYARLIIGQTDKIDDVFTDAVLRHKHDGKMTEEYFEESKMIEEFLITLHNWCWNQPPNQFYGVHYSDKSDTLFDIHEVIRHQLWKDNETGKSSMTNDAFPAFNWNKKEPLIKIK